MTNSTDSESIFDFASCDDTLIWQLHFTDMQYVCFVSSVRNSVYDIVQKDQPIELCQLIKKANYGRRGGEAVINVITALGLLKCISGEYYLTASSENYLTSTSIYSWNSMLNLFPEKFSSYMQAIESENYSDIESTGSFINNWSLGSITSAKAAQFTNYMQSLHVSAANGFAKKINLKKRFNVNSILDVAGGSGCFTIALAYHQSGLTGTVFELESVCKLTQTFIDKSNLPSDKVHTYSGNMFKDSFPDKYDTKYGYQACLYSNIFHDWNEEKCNYLAKKTYDSLPENGVILIHESLLNEDGNGPLITACLSFGMFLNTEGKQFKFSELKNLLANADFKDIGVIPTYGIFSLVYGIKK